MNTLKKLFLAAMFSVGMAASYEPAAAEIDALDSKIFMASPVVATFAGASARGLGFGAASLGYTIEYLIVAGGGAGAIGSTSGCVVGAGGGAGGAIDGSASVKPGDSFSIAIGAGGTAGSPGVKGSNGQDTTVSTLGTAVGGGAGGAGRNDSSTAQIYGNVGGSGGGSAGSSGTNNTIYNGVSGTVGQGNASGKGTYSTNIGSMACGGGGGATQPGGDYHSCAAYYGGKGGDGINWKSLGTYYAGGGPGCGDNGQQCAHGLGSGTNRGGGGSGGRGDAASTSSPGDSGIVIIRYLGTQKGSGGTITSAGGYTYHTFTGNGTFTA